MGCQNSIEYMFASLFEALAAFMKYPASMKADEATETSDEHVNRD
jgi:hypothetical protein